MKKICFIIISIILIIVTSITIGYLLLRKQKEEIPIVQIEELNVVLKDNLETPFLSKVKVSDFLASINYEIIDDYEINTEEIGEKEVEFTVLNNVNQKVKSSYKINVKDVNPPTIWLSGSYTISQYSSANLASSIMCIDDYDEHPTCEVLGDYNANVVGSYPLIYKATDSSGNTKEENFTLYVSNYSSTPYYGEPVSFSEALNKYKNENTMLGLDISAWQGEVDFDAIKDAGVEFVFIRIGSEDKDGRFVDMRFERNYSEAKRVGLKVGGYYYSYAEDETYALEDAKYVLKAIKGKEFDLPIAFDFEEWGSINKFHLSKYKLTKMAKTFLDELSKNGFKGANYSSKAYLDYIWLDTGYPTWLAHYTDETNYQGDYTYWQFSSMTSINGVGGYVDANVAYKNKMN